jgi:phosphopantothenate synthetase
MAKVLGFNPTQTNDYFEVNEKAKALEKLVKELVELNQAQDEEMRRIVGEYDKLYEKYEALKNKSNE